MRNLSENPVMSTHMALSCDLNVPFLKELVSSVSKQTTAIVLFFFLETDLTIFSKQQACLITVTR